MRNGFLLLLFCLLASSPLFANIFRINSSLATAAAQKIYKTLQEANNSSAVINGDTLMVEASAIEYADVTFTKRLVIIGPGYFLAENPQTQANPVQAVVRTMTMNAGSSGSVLMGLTFSNGYSGYRPNISVNNVVVMRCYLPNPVYFGGSVENIQILQNFFVTTAIEVGYYAYTFTGVVLRNNFISGQVSIPSENLYQRVFAAVENNIFSGNVALTTSFFRSNIVVTPTATVNVSSVNIQNNLVSNSQLPAANGNQTYDPANLFVGTTGNSMDGRYKLKPSSPYLTAGYNNTEPGIFGGTMAYVLSGLPPIPSIYQFTADGFANKQTGLPVNIKVKANQ